MVDKPVRDQQDWDVPLNAALDTLEAGATSKAEAARVAAIQGLSAAIAASRDRSTHTGTQDASSVTGLQTAVAAAVAADVVKIAGAQTITGTKTFQNPPQVPDGAFPLTKLGLTGTRDSTTVLHGDGVLRAAATGGGTGSGSANSLGTLNNPVTDVNAARPTGLTRVIWDTPTDPVNWAVGDINIQKGT